MAPPPIRFSLKYHGPEVDDGTMPIGLVAEALDGFAGAFRKTADFFAPPDYAPELRVSAPERGSFDIVVLASMALSQDPAQLAKAFVDAWDFAERIGRFLVDVMNLKKHAKGQPVNIRVEGEHNQITVINAENVELIVPREAFEVFRMRAIDRDLDKVVNPLRPGRIDSAELDVEGKPAVVVASEERKYFRPDIAESTTNPDELVGNLVSLNKEYKRGIMKIEGGRSVPYHYVGRDEDTFRQDFSYKGPVRARGTVQYDEDGNPTHLAIEEVERLQQEFPFPSAGDSEDNR